MISNSFTATAALKTKLIKIDLLYKEIMVIPVSARNEVYMRLQANINHLEGWANLTNQPLTRPQIQEMLNQFQAKNESPIVAKVLHYKNAVNYVRENWSVNPAEVTFDTIRELSTILDVGLVSRESVEPLLAYLHTSQFHPVIQSGLIHLAFYPSRSAYLLSLLYLAKAGYDLRGWLSLEDCWSQNKESYLKVIKQATESTNSELWLEYYCEAVIVQMTAVKTELTQRLTVPYQSTTKHINHRQKSIISLIEQSATPVTNRQIQDEFRVSQITASRDLAKLSIAGLIATHGSGRSTAYTKI